MPTIVSSLRIFLLQKLFCIIYSVVVPALYKNLTGFIWKQISRAVDFSLFFWRFSRLFQSICTGNLACSSFSLFQEISDIDFSDFDFQFNFKWLIYKKNSFG
jgi:hypothetical protein